MNHHPRIESAESGRSSAENRELFASCRPSQSGKRGELVVGRCARAVGELAQAVCRKSERIHISGLHYVGEMYAS